MKYLRLFIADIRKNVLTEQFIWVICILISVELFIAGFYVERLAARDAAAAAQHPPCDGVP